MYCSQTDSSQGVAVKIGFRIFLLAGSTCIRVWEKGQLQVLDHRILWWDAEGTAARLENIVSNPTEKQHVLNCW